METDIRERSLYLLHMLACQVGFINDRFICGDIGREAARRQAQELADETIRAMQDAGALEAWVVCYNGAGGVVGISWQVLLRNDLPLHGNLIPKGRA